jgi:hypothetical protein
LNYSKTKVNRAGATLADVLLHVLERKLLSEGRRREGLEAMEIVEWWRSEHAHPLSRVAANLRYYAADEGKPVASGLCCLIKMPPTEWRQSCVGI